MQVHAVDKHCPNALLEFLVAMPEYRDFPRAMVAAMPHLLTSLQLLSGAGQLPAGFLDSVYRTAVRIVLACAGALLPNQAPSPRLPDQATGTGGGAPAHGLAAGDGKHLVPTLGLGLGFRVRALYASML